jgi:hypothetical protein
VKKIIIAFASVLFLMGCIQRDDYNAVPEVIDGFKPIYVKDTTNFVDSVYLTPPRVLNNPGKIYLYKQYLIVNESGKGAHIFDNSNPQTPIAIAFINIPLNYDISIKNNVMYADAYLGLVVIDISMLPSSINILSFIRYKTNRVYPPLPNGGPNFNFGRRMDVKTYFECIDPQKGLIIGWEATTLIKPKCYQ